MKLYQKYLLLLLVVLVVAIIVFNAKSEELFIKRVDNVLINLLNKQLEREKSEAFAFALALAQNESLQASIKNDDSEKAFKIIQQYMETLNAFSGTQVRTQILSEDFIIFARSWDNSVSGLPLEQYRPDLLIIEKNRKPRVSFEAARRLVLIATIPIITEDKVIGFVEVIKLFDGLDKFFKPYEIDLIVLLEEKFEDQSVLLRDYDRIDDCIVANEGANIHHVKHLRKLGLSRLRDEGVHQGPQHVYFSQVINNGEGMRIGSFILALSKKKMDIFKAFEEELETLFTYARKDLYYAVKDRITPKGLYKDVQDKDLLRLKDSVHPEDRPEVLKALQKRLEEYSKEELISLLLEIDTHAQIRGKIE